MSNFKKNNLEMMQSVWCIECDHKTVYMDTFSPCNCGSTRWTLIPPIPKLKTLLNPHRKD